MAHRLICYLLAIMNKNDYITTMAAQKPMNAFYDPSANIFYKSPLNNPTKKKNAKTTKNKSSYKTNSMAEQFLQSEAKQQGEYLLF
jgi:hypothetical protein